MKKTLISIAVASVFASGAALACANGSCGWGSANTSAVTSATAGSIGNGISIVGSTANAWNTTGASSSYSYGGRDNNASASSEASSFGGTSTTSFGLTAGNAQGYTFGTATQQGSASAGNGVGIGESNYPYYWYGYYGPYDASYASVSANSSVNQDSFAATAVFGTGIAAMSSEAGAWNASGAAASSDVDRFCNGCTIGHTDVVAGTMGGSYAGAEGVVLGQAIGEAGANAHQNGSAYAGGSAEQGIADYWYWGWYGYSYPYQQADASVSTYTNGGANAYVGGLGLFAGSSQHSQLSGAFGDASASFKVCNGGCSVKSLSDSDSFAFSKSTGHDWDVGFGVASGISGGYSNARATGTTDVDYLVNPHYYYYY
jgi:hypothetical protein